jgi:hypothetical protein
VSWDHADRDGAPTRDDLDFRGSPRLTGRAEWWWYLVAGVTYIVASVQFKWLLAWWVGPAWLVAVIVAGPAAVERWRARR